MSMLAKFGLSLAITLVPTTLGYAARRLGLLTERVAVWMMAFVMVIGYSTVSFFSIWALQLRAEHAWLPVLGTAHAVIMAALGLLIGRAITRQRAEVGLFAIASAMGNTGFTMGGLVIFFVHGAAGLGLVSIYCLIWMPVMVLLLYPIARHHAAPSAGGSLGNLLLRSIFDWRSIGLPIAVTAVILSLTGVPRPEVIGQWRIVDIAMYTVTPMAFFAIGLRLHVSYVGTMRKMIVALAGMRFVVAAMLGVAFCAATQLTPWPLVGKGRDVILIESFVPPAITSVAIANMFHLKPREASVLFVSCTLLYMIVLLPLVLWLFG